MSVPALLQYALFLLIIGLLVKPVGGYLGRVFAGEKTMLDPVLRPVERALYRVLGVSPKEEMAWPTYTGAFLAFSLVGTLVLYAILRLQSFLPGGQPPPNWEHRSTRTWR